MPIIVRHARAGLLVLTSLALLFTACDSDDDDNGITPPEGGIVAGRVTAAGTGVADASVSLTGTETGTTTTGADGRYQFDGLNAGAYTLTLTVPAGFELATGETAEQTATLTGDETATVDWQLVAATGGSVAGRVTAAGTGVADASITLAGAGTGTTTTGADGSYQFTGLDAGAYTLTLTVPAGFELGTGETAEKTATLTGDETATVDWSLDATGGGDATVVTLSGTSFSPSNITITVGTTVRWVAQDGVHTVTPDNPDQPGAWASTGLSAGQTFEHTFTTAGTFDYHCQPHRSLGMVGRVVVQ